MRFLLLVLIVAPLATAADPGAAAAIQATTFIGPAEDRDEGTQAQRKLLVKMMTDAGLLAEIQTTGSIPKLWATAKFKALTFREKEALVSQVCAYLWDGTDRTFMVQLVDNIDGKVFGSYAVATPELVLR